MTQIVLRSFLFMLLPLSAALAAPSQPKYLCEPARLGADETTTSRNFQLADFNGDGLPDLLQLSYGPDRAWVILNRGSEGRPFLGAPSRFPCNFSELRGLSLNTTDAWAADFDGDGDLDLVIGTTGGQVVLVVNDGDRGWPVFEEGKLLVDKPVPGATLAAADVDGDGRPDLFVQPAVGGLRLYRNTSDGKSVSAGPAAEVKDTAGKPVVAPCPSPVDFNGDGALDIVSVTPQGGALIHLGVKDGKGLVFQPAVPALDEGGKPIPGGNDVALFDWDGDGKLDLLVLDDSCAIRCHAGMEKGKPVFRSRAAPVHGNTFGRADERYAPTLADFDKDGRSDLMLGGSYDARCGGSSPLLRAYRNTLPSGPCAFGAGSFVLGPKNEALGLGPLGYMGSGDPCLTDFDGDGRLDLLWYMTGSPTNASAMLYSGDETAPRAFKGVAVKLATLGLENKPLILRPLAADWNGDGATDLIVGSYGYNLDRLSLLVNRGSSKAPNFGDAAILKAAGKELKGTHPGTGFPCVWDWDGDGRPDLLVSGPQEPDKYSNATFRWFRNKDGSADLDAPVEIKIGPQGTRVPFAGKPAAGDLDGDGVTDLLISRDGFRGHMCLVYGELWMLRGVAEDAPDPVRDLSAAGTTAKSVTLSWTAPSGAAGGELRCSPRPIDEVTWFMARPAARKPAPANGGAQTFEFDGLEPGAVYYFAVCSFGPKGGRSGISNNAMGATRPLVIVSLVQGQPAQALGLTNYSGCVDVRVPGKEGQGLGVRAGEEQWGACQSYLKFDLGPLAGRKVRKAWITLTGSAPTEWNIRCREVLAAWDAKTISSKTKDGVAAWTSSDYGPSLPEISPHELQGLKRWDATELVGRRLTEAKPALSLNLSTFIANQTFGFADAEAKDPAQRPALTVILTETATR
jgi:hypothetical protein